MEKEDQGFTNKAKRTTLKYVKIRVKSKFKCFHFCGGILNLKTKKARSLLKLKRLRANQIPTEAIA